MRNLLVVFSCVAAILSADEASLRNKESEELFQDESIAMPTDFKEFDQLFQEGSISMADEALDETVFD